MVENRTLVFRETIGEHAQAISMLKNDDDLSTSAADGLSKAKSILELVTYSFWNCLLETIISDIFCSTHLLL